MNQNLEVETKKSLMKSYRGQLRVVYIAGVGRSGSTVLDSVLGNHPAIQSVGELSRLANDGWIHNFYCSCGEPAKECPFWSAVQQVWCDSNGGVTIPEYIETQNKVEQIRKSPFMLRENWRKSPTFQIYAEQTVLLLKAIQMVSGCTTIVDSSKGVERALAMSMIPEID